MTEEASTLIADSQFQIYMSSWNFHEKLDQQVLLSTFVCELEQRSK